MMLDRVEKERRALTNIRYARAGNGTNKAFLPLRVCENVCPSFFPDGRYFSAVQRRLDQYYGRPAVGGLCVVYSSLSG
ncbi:hypothetical protein DdX_06838 [Ditylenchus destructor]|uniref:Uncharacterized protein n=1 Tax=Ditylenchus destructor TaxID=166010 RepID=A0AAD4N961_9BILA|nr:hypothetical protein DdX_06838 [Ditylenchus destructor]